MSQYREAFSRRYNANYTDEVFVVTDVIKTNPITYEFAEI